MKCLFISCFFCLALAICPHTLAGIQIDLVPDHEGPYLPNETVTMDFWLSTQNPLYYIETVRFDFRDTDESLVLSDQFEFDLNGISFHPDWWWVWADMPVPIMFISVQVGCLDGPPCAHIILPSTEPVHIGTLDVELPDNPGIFRLDAMNADESNWIAGGGFIRHHSGQLHAYDGSLTGGIFDFWVVPEPSTLLLGILAVAFHRRAPR